MADNIEGVDTEVVGSYLGVRLDNKLDWSANSDTVFRKGQSIQRLALYVLHVSAVELRAVCCLYTSSSAKRVQR